MQFPRAGRLPIETFTVDFPPVTDGLGLGSNDSEAG